MNRFKKTLRNISIKSVHRENIELKEPFIDFASRFAHLAGTVLLMSGGNLDCAKHHILGINPWLTFHGNNKRSTVSINNQNHDLEDNPFDILRVLLNSIHLDGKDSHGPISSGLLGYLSYDLKDFLEHLPRTSINNLGLPYIYFISPTILVVRNREDHTTCVYTPEINISDHVTIKADHTELNHYQSINSHAKQDFHGTAEGFKSGFSRSEYEDSINTIIDYISAGHVYQVNMSQRFEMGFSGNPFCLFKTLYQKNPAPFFAYVNAGDHHIISTSPERFIKQAGNMIETRPIKGTRPRGKTELQDKKLRLELTESKKDDAELSMIVDLLRNDIGKVCEGGTVNVTQHKRVEAYQNVYHLVSVVEGILKEGQDSVDIIQAAFPGGSITGCPKIRAMEIIDELEPVRRHIYTGSIGYISFHDTMDLSIAIRTATVYTNKIIFSVGGGIIYDSIPSDEYEETFHKGETLISVFKGKTIQEIKKQYAWINGKIKPLENTMLPVSDQGFLFGYGFFETIRITRGKPEYLSEHMQRFDHSWSCLFNDEPPDLSWEEIIDRIVHLNRLNTQTGAVKIIATLGKETAPPFEHSIIVMSRPYQNRLKSKGTLLAVYPEPRQSNLADHKTLNYLYYKLAKNWALDNHADEALILNPDGSISETDTANILLVYDQKDENTKTVIKPASPHVLPGIMEQVVLNVFSKWNYSIKKRIVMPEELYSADTVLITNSLIGALPVTSLDGKELNAASDLWININKEVLG